MMGRRGAIGSAFAAAIAAAAVLLAHAAGPRRIRAIVLPAYLATPASPCQRPDYDALSSVLATTGPGAFGRLRSSTAREVLGRFLATLERIGPRTRPELFPTPASRVAYLVNAHIAWTLALHDLGGLVPEDLSRFSTVRFTVDGETRTLTAIEDAVNKLAEDEPRLVLFLNPGLVGGPPLPPAALEDYALDFQVSRQARRCGRTPGFWSLDVNARRLEVSWFAERLPALPDEPRERARRLLTLVPPPDVLRQRIDATCGPSLERCAVRFRPALG